MDKLKEIISAKQKSLKPRLRPIKMSELETLSQSKVRSRFLNTINSTDSLSVIAEIKRKSPSAGNIAENTDAVEQARIYHNAKADALSILTDMDYFGGSLNDLWNVVDFLQDHQSSIPCLRKDFMLHPLQVLEALEAGADCILIIVKALSSDAIKYLREAAYHAKLDILYEVHSERELEKALCFDPEIIGVNNRDLTRFVTDIAESERLIPQIPNTIIKVSESGIFSVNDAARARDCGADAILVGEALMRSEDPENLIQNFHSL